MKDASRDRTSAEGAIPGSDWRIATPSSKLEDGARRYGCSRDAEGPCCLAIDPLVEYLSTSVRAKLRGTCPDAVVICLRDG